LYFLVLEVKEVTYLTNNGWLYLPDGLEGFEAFMKWLTLIYDIPKMVGVYFNYMQTAILYFAAIF